MSIAANKIVGIRAALVHDVTTARLAAEHNHAQILCLGARVTGPVVAEECIAAWLAAPFDPRHQRRLDKIAQME
jgi:ribose 5-phosphate isomerase B